MSGSNDRLTLGMASEQREARRILLARLFIGVVLAWNVQCAVAFLVDPATYAAGFELDGTGAQAAVRGTGLLFLMWNVPYAFALWQPVGRRVSLLEALAMQAIGLVGESLILLSLPTTGSQARASLTRFVGFDAAGLVLLLAALAVTVGARTTVRGAPRH